MSERSKIHRWTLTLIFSHIKKKNSIFSSFIEVPFHFTQPNFFYLFSLSCMTRSWYRSNTRSQNLIFTTIKLNCSKGSLLICFWIFKNCFLPQCGYCIIVVGVVGQQPFSAFWLWSFNAVALSISEPSFLEIHCRRRRKE